MKHSSPALRGALLSATGAGLVFLSSSVWAQPSANDLILAHFYPPEFLLQCQKVIGLTEEQKAFVQSESKKAQTSLTNLQAQIRKEAEALVPLVSSDRVDEQKVLAQSEKIRGLENEIKRTQFALLIHLKNKLTPEQQAQLKDLAARNAVIQEKLRKVQTLARQREQEGRNLSVLDPYRKEFESLMLEAKFKEAETVVDRTLRVLEGLK